MGYFDRQRLNDPSQFADRLSVVHSHDNGDIEGICGDFSVVQIRVL